MIEADIVAEAQRIVAAGTEAGVVLRLLGGLAVRLRAPSAAHRSLQRTYLDIDFATPARRSAAVEELIAGLGYAPNKNFNLLNGSTRLLFYDQEHGRQIDVFVRSFEMCHRIPLDERIATDTLTIPLAELLLTKLQIVQLNDKDVRDICALLIDHPLGDADGETINAARIATLCAEDWGLWKTTTLSMQAVRERLANYELEPAAVATVTTRLQELSERLDRAPKSLRWKMRARVGERIQWYTLPEEVQRG